MSEANDNKIYPFPHYPVCVLALVVTALALASLPRCGTCSICKITASPVEVETKTEVIRK